MDEGHRLLKMCHVRDHTERPLACNLVAVGLLARVARVYVYVGVGVRGPCARASAWVGWVVVGKRVCVWGGGGGCVCVGGGWWWWWWGVWKRRGGGAKLWGGVTERSGLPHGSGRSAAGHWRYDSCRMSLDALASTSRGESGGISGCGRTDKPPIPPPSSLTGVKAVPGGRNAAGEKVDGDGSIEGGGVKPVLLEACPACCALAEVSSMPSEPSGTRCAEEGQASGPVEAWAGRCSGSRRSGEPAGLRY